MDVLIDTNVIINFLTGREDPFRDASWRIMKLCDSGKLRGFLAFHSLSTIWYVIRKHYSEIEARFVLERVCKILTVASDSQEQVIQAIENREFRDFEDCLQDKCAQNVGASYLVTCNIKDFRDAETHAVTPDEMLNILKD